MSSEFNDSEEPTLLAINIDGLMEQVDYHVSDPEEFSAALDLAGNAPLSEIWSRLEGILKRAFKDH